MTVNYDFISMLGFMNIGHNALTIVIAVILMMIVISGLTGLSANERNVLKEIFIAVGIAIGGAILFGAIFGGKKK